MNNNKKTICLIHSDQDINNLFKTFLEYSGYQVYGFTTPTDGLLSFDEKRQDLVMIGLVFSEMDGLGVYKRLREMDDNVNILIVTANVGSAELIQDIYPETRNNIVYEPITLGELKDKVDSILL
ncbi:MAG: response regulator [Nitrososphaeraceae archaeon]|nr:response regulator [Nitrososphaeraceae archaeon]